MAALGPTDLRVAPAVFVVGGSAFPQNPANGPTATIGMSACWAADAIKDYVRNPASLA